MHKLIFILTTGDNEEEAHQNASEYIDEYLIDNGYDWYQGITASKRWPEEEKYDTPMNARKNQSVIEKYIKIGQDEALEWIKKGNEELKENGHEKDFGWTLCSFHIASGTTVCWVFDNTGWSYEGIRDKAELEKVFKNYTDKIWMVGFDAHH